MGIPASRSASTRKILHLSSGTTCRSSRHPVHPGAPDTIPLITHSSSTNVISAGARYRNGASVNPSPFVTLSSV